MAKNDPDTNDLAKKIADQRIGEIFSEEKLGRPDDGFIDAGTAEQMSGQIPLDTRIRNGLGFCLPEVQGAEYIANVQKPEGAALPMDPYFEEGEMTELDPEAQIIHDNFAGKSLAVLSERTLASLGIQMTENGFLFNGQAYTCLLLFNDGKLGLRVTPPDFPDASKSILDYEPHRDRTW